MGRVTSWLLLIGLAVSVVVLGFSDTVPDMIRAGVRPLGDVAASAAGAVGVEAPGWVDQLRAEPDVVFHVLQWGAIAAIVVVLAAGRIGPFDVAAGLIGLSTLVEVLQMELSTTRRFELTDVAGNVAGIMIGATFGVLAVAAIEARRRRAATIRAR
ncbi:MAG: hypothetical protein AAGD18_22455 [Actinomycetota bacterium]